MTSLSRPDGSLGASLGSLFRFLSFKRRLQLGLQLVLMLASAAAELATLGAIVPFLALLSSPEKGNYHIPVLSVDLDIEAISLLFIVLAAVAALVRAVTQWAGFRFAFGTGGDLAFQVFRRSLFQPYAWHAARSSSEIIAGLTKVNAVVSSIINPMLQGMVALFISIAIVTALMLVDAKTAMTAAISVGTLYVGISMAMRRQILRNGKIVSANEKLRIQTVQEGLGGIRDVILDGTQQQFSETFDRYNRKSRMAQAANNVAANVPRYFVEAAGMICIVLLANFMVSGSGNLAGAVPILGALALGAQRMLPQLQMIYFAWTSVNGARAQLNDLLELVAMPIPPDADAPRDGPVVQADMVPGSAQVEFRKVCFGYLPSGAPVLEDIDLVIPRGARIGFIGKTGSGKSTLIDLLMGLLDPVSGDLRIDGHKLDVSNRRQWQRRIAHVPQNIFLADVSIAQNIAFGLDPKTIDMERVRRAVEMAQLADLIAELPDGYESFVGERGVRLSGGQRQRIGLARAFYREVDVLVFDEATSALDDRTEALVMDAINGLGRNMTLLMVAHRLSTLRHCDRIVELSAGRIARQAAPELIL